MHGDQHADDLPPAQDAIPGTARAAPYVGDWVGFRFDHRRKYTLTLRVVAQQGLVAGAGLESRQRIQVLGALGGPEGTLTLLMWSEARDEYECTGVIEGNTFLGRWCATDGRQGRLRLRQLRVCEPRHPVAE